MVTFIVRHAVAWFYAILPWLAGMIAIALLQKTRYKTLPGGIVG